MIAQPSFCQTWSETPKTGFLTTRLNYHQIPSNTHHISSSGSDRLISERRPKHNKVSQNCSIIIWHSLPVNYGSRMMIHYPKMGNMTPSLSFECFHFFQRNFKRAAPVAEWVRSLYFSALNHSIISPLCLV